MWTTCKRIIHKVNKENRLPATENRQYTFFRCIMRRGKLEYVTKEIREEQQGKTDRDDAWLVWHHGIPVSEINVCARDRRLWRDMITNVT